MLNRSSMSTTVITHVIIINNIIITGTKIQKEVRRLAKADSKPVKATTNLLESLQDFMTLAEMSKQQLQ